MDATCADDMKNRMGFTEPVFSILTDCCDAISYGTSTKPPFLCIIIHIAPTLHSFVLPDYNRAPRCQGQRGDPEGARQEGEAGT